MRINSAGEYKYCRWAKKDHVDLGHNIQHMSPVEFFQDTMSVQRSQLLQGQALPGCNDCQLMEQHQKVSGRQKQLLKVGVDLEHFDKTMQSSPWLPVFEQSWQQQGYTAQYPQDWQIDLGNYCNSSCVFCHPRSSSKLAVEFKKIGLIESLPPAAWCDDPELLKKFLNTLQQSPRVTYLHFIGGETLITPAFAKILQALISAGLHQQTSLGFTTNLTVWNQPVIDLLTQFKEVNLGMSIECMHKVNDYVRYGGTLTKTQEILDKWIKLAQQHQWLVQFRTTPTVLSLWHLDTVYYHALEHGIAIESCNFLDRPEFMRPSVLPPPMRQQVIEKLQQFQDYAGNTGARQVINTRDPNQCHDQIVQDAQSYINYLKSCPDESQRLPELVEYIKMLESSRGNQILDYLPEYEQLLRSAGY